MANKWIEHIRTYAKNKNISYSCAVSDPDCSKTYKEKQAKTKAEPKEKPKAEPKAEVKAEVKKVEPNTYEANKEINKTRRALTPAEKAEKQRDYIYAYSLENFGGMRQEAYEEKWKNTGLLPENKKEWEEAKKETQELLRRLQSVRRRGVKKMLKGDYKQTKEEKKQREKEREIEREKAERERLNPSPPEPDPFAYLKNMKKKSRGVLF